MFTLNTDLFPDSPGAAYSLAEACYVTGDAGAAIKHYERYLVMQPGDKDAIKKLEMLRKIGEN